MNLFTKIKNASTEADAPKTQTSIVAKHNLNITAEITAITFKRACIFCKIKKCYSKIRVVYTCINKNFCHLLYSVMFSIFIIPLFFFYFNIFLSKRIENLSLIRNQICLTWLHTIYLLFCENVGQNKSVNKKQWNDIEQYYAVSLKTLLLFY